MWELYAKEVPMGKPYCSHQKHTQEGSQQQFRLYINYRKLNSLLPSVIPAKGTKKGTFAFMPLPKIDESFVLLRGAKYFIALDLCSSYYHIKLHEEPIPQSTFTTVFSKFEFLGLPFGLSQGPDFFIHLIYNLLGLDKTSDKSQGSGYLAYLDNILIYSKTETDHLEMLNSAFECLSKACPKIKLGKCSFKEQIHYLGHLVSGISILPLSDKIKALMKLQPPTNIKDVRHFHGLTGYYRIFICNDPAIAHPLNCLTHKSQAFNWTPDCQPALTCYA